MDPIPIDASPDAADWITERVMAGALDGEWRVPALCVWVHSRTWDRDERLIEEIREEFFDVRWFSPGWVAGMSYPEVVVSGLRLVATPRTVLQLAGKCLVLRPVEFGFSARGEKHIILKAVEPVDDGQEPG